MDGAGGVWRPKGLGWWTGLLALGVLAVILAGVWQIASTRRTIREHDARLLDVETRGRAHAIESALATTRADLAFLSRSTALTQSEAGPKGRDAAGSAMLLFLRGHPEVLRLTVRTGDGSPLVESGRPRGVPGYWVPSDPAGAHAATPPPSPAGIAATFDVGPPVPGTTGMTTVLFAAVDGRVLLEHTARPRVACELRDGAGRSLASEAAPAPDRGGPQAAAAALAAEGWSVPGPWRLTCTTPGAAAETLEPTTARYRETILLNLGIMALGLVLGGLAIQQARRRMALEERARQQARVGELERQLFRAERLSTVGRLAAGIAHEVNNPLEGMSNYLRLAGDALERGEVDRVARYLGGVHEGLHRAASIVRRVLEQAHRSDRPAEVVDLRAIAEGAVEFVRSRDEFHGIRFERGSGGEAATVRGDREMLGQVLLNLLVNACEAQNAQGEVLVRIGREGDSVVVEVADRGPGVPEEARERIFEAFHSTKGSTGLGLSICRSIVQQHGGDLSVRERPGGGAVFVVRLRAAHVGA